MSLNNKLKNLSMDEEERSRLIHRHQYLGLNYKIMKLRMVGQDPPDDLINHAIEIGRLAEIPEEELSDL